MSTFKSIHVNDDITGCIADYIIDQGVNGFVNWEKWKSGKLVQYGHTAVTIEIDNNGDGSSIYHLYNSIGLTIQLYINNISRKFTYIGCISNTGAFASISINTAANLIGYWLYSDVKIASRDYGIYFIDI